MNSQEFHKVYGLPPYSKETLDTCTSTLAVDEVPPECFTPYLALCYFDQDHANAEKIPPQVISESPKLIQLMIGAAPDMIRLISPNVPNYAAYVDRAVEANPAVVKHLSPAAIVPNVDAWLARDTLLLKYLPEQYQKTEYYYDLLAHAPTLIEHCPEHLLTWDLAKAAIDQSISCIAAIVRIKGIPFLSDPVREGYWPEKMKFMKPDSIAGCLEDIRMTPRPYKTLLQLWLSAQPLSEICPLIDNPTQLSLVRECFSTDEVAQTLAKNEKLLSMTLEQDLGL
jgi:hypothetical protein